MDVSSIKDGTRKVLFEQCLHVFSLLVKMAVTNQGFPAIVGSPGHILVVNGGDAHYVYLVDSAPANRTAFTYAQFLAFWDGFSVLITPR